MVGKNKTVQVIYIFPFTSCVSRCDSSVEERLISIIVLLWGKKFTTLLLVCTGIYLSARLWTWATNGDTSSAAIAMAAA